MPKHLFTATAAVMVMAAIGAGAAHAVCVKPVAPATGPTVVQLNAILANPDCSDALLQFARTEHNDENILFLRAVDGGQDKKAIYNKYISVKSKTEINIPSATRRDLDVVAAKGNWARLNFTQAVNDIKHTVAGDTLGRFYAAGH